MQGDSLKVMAKKKLVNRMKYIKTEYSVVSSDDYLFEPSSKFFSVYDLKRQMQIGYVEKKTVKFANTIEELIDYYIIESKNGQFKESSVETTLKGYDDIIKPLLRNCVIYGAIKSNTRVPIKVAILKGFNEKGERMFELI